MEKARQPPLVWETASVRDKRSLLLHACAISSHWPIWISDSNVLTDTGQSRSIVWFLFESTFCMYVVFRYRELCLWHLKTVCIKNGWLFYARRSDVFSRFLVSYLRYHFDVNCIICLVFCLLSVFTRLLLISVEDFEIA